MPSNILQVGLGNYGQRHLLAWHELELGDRLFIAELDEAKWENTHRFNFPRQRMTREAADFLDLVDIVDIVTPTDSHFKICAWALEAGKDVFIEKPMTMTSAEARQVVDLAAKTGRMIQVGYNFRFHPIAQVLKSELTPARFGKVRYLTGSFMGFKRCRNDVGVTHTDGIHFLDLFNWLMDSFPTEAYAVCRDHFARGLEDFSIVLLTYPDGAVAKVESGYIQAGRWKDRVVPGAMTSKDVMVVGERATAEVDFEAETLVFHDAHHELRNGVWTAVVKEGTQRFVEECSPVQMVCRELSAFLQSVENRRPAGAGPIEGGVQLAILIEAIYESARTNAPVRVPPVAVAV